MDRAELKKRVRALLISSKQGCTPNNLLRDYKSVFGEGLPFHEFGYRSVVAMAEDMPDVVRIQYQGGGGGVVLLRGVADESTRHIAKMVSRQRNTGYHHLKVDQPARKASTTPSVPFHIQGCLRQLMHAYPNGLPIEQFEEAYARRFGYYLQLRRMKCNTLQELVNNVPDVLKINRGSAGRILIVEASRSSYNTVESENSSSRPNRLLNQSHLLDEQSMRISDQLSNYDDVSPSNEDQSKVLSSQSTINHSNTSSNVQLSGMAVPVPAKVKENILKLLHAKHLGIWYTSLEEEYKNMFGHSLELGAFRNVMELLSNMKDVCVMEKPSVNSGDWLVKSREQPSQGSVAAVSAEETRAPDYFNLKEYITRLMQDYPTGILLSNLPALFKLKYKFELPVEKLGFNSIATLVNSISDVVKKVIQGGQLLIVPVARSTVTSAIAQSSRVHSNGSVENDNAKKANEVVENDGALPVQKRKSMPSLPAEPIMPSQYTALALPQSSSTINVTVSHAINPSKFFIQLIGKDYSHLLNTLMITISNFYCSVTGVEKAIARPVLGQACCAVFDGDGCWYRAEVIGIPTPFTVLVKYVDYGNVCELPIGSIRKSQPEYLELPTQAIECCLANVQPKERVWSNDACKIFQEAVYEKPLVAFVQQPQAVTSHPLHIFLCDTSTKDDVYIHELLISKGLAISTVEQQQTATTPTSSDALLSQFKEQFLNLQQTMLLHQQILQQQLMVTGQQLRQNGQVNGNETVPSWQPQGLQSILPSASQGAQLPPPPVMDTNSEHRKKMAAAKDIWSSDSETEDEKLELNSSENMTKQLEAKLERLNEERKNILERMTYSSSSGAISSWVEKLQNIEGIIKVTKESLKRRANGLPPLPPPGLSHMQPAKQPQPENQSSGIIKPKGVSTTNKPIIGLGRGKRFSKQNSLPNGVGETTAISVSDVPVAETVLSPVPAANSSNGMVAQSQLMKPQVSNSNEMFSQDQSKKQQQLATSSEMFGWNHFLQSSSNSESFSWSQPTLTSSTNEAFGQSQLRQLMKNNNKDNQDQLKRQENFASGDEVFSLTRLLQQASSDHRLNQDQAKKQQLAGSSEVFGESKLQQLANSSELFDHNQPERQQVASNSDGHNKVQQTLSSREYSSDNQPLKKQMTSNSNTLDQGRSEMASLKLLSNGGEQSQKHLGFMTSKQPSKNNEKTTGTQSGSAASVSDGIARSFAKLSLSHNAPPFTPAVITSTTTQSLSPTTPIATSRIMSYSSAVMSQPPRKPPPLMRPQQQITRTPLMHQTPPPLLSVPPHVYGQNQHQVVGLGRGVGPWSPGPPPPLNSWGGNGHYVHGMPPPPVHFNFDHHSPFYEIPSSGLHNPFYAIPPMGSSSGLDII